MSSIAIMRWRRPGVTWNGSRGPSSRDLRLLALGEVLELHACRDSTMIVSSLTRWYCSDSASPALMWRILPT